MGERWVGSPENSLWARAGFEIRWGSCLFGSGVGEQKPESEVALLLLKRWGSGSALSFSAKETRN